MASIKFSAFTNEAVDAATTQLVGYKVGDTSANYRYDVAQLKTALASDTIFTTSPTEVVPTGQVIKITDKIQFQKSTSVYQGWEFEIGTPSAPYAKLKVGNREFVTAYMANQAWSLGQLTDTTNSFHFNTGATTMSDGYAMRVHASTASPYGALILKGYGTSTDKTFTIQDSGANETFSIQDDGVAKFSGQAYTEQHDSLAGNATVNWNDGNVQYIQLASSANTFTPSNPKDGATYILQIKQPSSGVAGTITWGASVKWPAATAPTLSTTNDYIDIVTLIYNGTTTHYYAAATLDLR